MLHVKKTVVWQRETRVEVCTYQNNHWRKSSHCQVYDSILPGRQLKNFSFNSANFDFEQNKKIQIRMSPYTRWGLPKKRPVVQTAGAVSAGGEVVHGWIQQTRASLTTAGLSVALPPGIARHASSLLKKHQRPNDDIILEVSDSCWVVVLCLWWRKEDIRKDKEEA